MNLAGFQIHRAVTVCVCVCASIHVSVQKAQKNVDEF